MNIPMSWLKAITPIKDTTQEFAQKITNTGMAVENILQTDPEITGIVVGQVVELTRHPDADRLWVTKTDIGSEVLQIVTGADNLQVGDIVPVAVNGATLVNGLKIKKSKMRGLESNGMLVSVEELGYTSDDYPEAPKDGIYVFPEPHPLGEDAKPYLGLADDVLEFEILSNRPDTNSVMGMARETAVLYNRQFTMPIIQLKEAGAPVKSAELVTVEIRDPKLCPRYIARVVTDVTIGPSPKWMRRRLSMSGIKPINNIVDITNYVMLEYGQPLHAFDINTLSKKDDKHAVVVRTAQAGETFTTLDGVVRNLSDTTLLIADHEKPIGIAGIMGGENSRITDDTKTILFESANFDAANIRLSARRLGMRTDASARYERGLDPNMAIICINRAMELVEQLECGTVIPGVVDAYPSQRRIQKITYSPARINQQLGLPESTVSADDICTYLRRLGIDTNVASDFSAPNVRGYEAIIPTHRADITCEADLAEEVGRFYGLNRIPSRYLQQVDGTKIVADPIRRFTASIKNASVALGYYEAKTMPLESIKVFDKLMLPKDHKSRSHVALLNPLNEDMGILRTLTLNSLLESLSRNFNNSTESTHLFEIAKTFHPKSLPVTELPYEPLYLTLAAYGPEMDFLAIKGDAEELLATANITGVEFLRHQLPYTHPGRTALITSKQKLWSDNSNFGLLDFASTEKLEQKPWNAVLGYIGELHPQVCENYQIDTTVYIAVLCMETLQQLSVTRTAFTQPSIFPALTRDLAMVVAESITAAEVETAIRERGGPLLTEVKLFDVYQGPQIEDGHKSLAYALRFRANNRTLSDKDVQKPLRSIVDNLTKKLGAQIRDK